MLSNFFQVHSNSKEVSYLPWQNKYPKLKTTCHIKAKCFVWSEHLVNLHLVKYLISVAAALMKDVFVLNEWIKLFFTHALRLNSFSGSSIHLLGRRKLLIPSGRMFSKIYSPAERRLGKKWKSGYENHMFFTSLRTFYISTLLLSCLFACHFFSKFLIFICTQVFVHILLLYRKKK